MPFDEQNAIVVRGAREHNLKNIDVIIPKQQLVVITGLSGSGKSTLAFDTIFAEGQRRYVESLSAYARQFLGQLDRPDVDQITGLSPAIAVDQKSTSRSPRSTVGTVTEVYDHLRLLFARIGQPHCPICARPITQQTPSQIVDAVLGLPDGVRLMVLAPLVEDRRGSHAKVLDDARRAGFVRVRVDGTVLDLDEAIELDKNSDHSIEIVVDRLVMRQPDPPLPPEQHPDRVRVSDSVETALKASGGTIIIQPVEGDPLRYSEFFACPEHGPLSGGAIEPRSFSFNSPHGACPACDGLGELLEFAPDLVIPDQSLSLRDGAIVPWRRTGKNARQYWDEILASLAETTGFSLDVPVRDLPQWAIDVVLHGSGADRKQLRYKLGGKIHRNFAPFEGVLPQLRRRLREAADEASHAQLAQYMTTSRCPSCQGTRLRPESLAVTVKQVNIAQVAALPITAAYDWASALLNDGLRSNRERLIAAPIMREVAGRLRFLLDVGLHYLTLDRAAATLSGGEAQRIRLATQIGAGLSGVLYVLDEPSIGLHARDHQRLLQTLLHLRDLGNSVLVVEHDEETIRAAQWLVDIGPGAGSHGGEVVAMGTVATVAANPRSITGQYLSGQRRVPVPPQHRPADGAALVIRNARGHNLCGIDVSFPLGTFICVTGVSGSGKSTLVNDILYARLAQVLNRARTAPAAHDSIEGLELVDKVIAVDQAPLGRSGRSNPATYTGMFDPLRQLFAGTPEAKLRGYTPGRFSFNVKGGRCEACKGEGTVQIEMQFLPDLYVPCEQCAGLRYNRETLDIKYRGYSIADVLALTVEAAATLFVRIPALARRLETLQDVGLGYVTLGQPAPTLSGGEAQRVKLATELARRGTGHTVYVLDEPTTGLHWADIERLLGVLGRLVDAGNTVIVIEHHLDVIKTADWIIDLGPGGGDEGGSVVATGPPEAVSTIAESWTGRFLAPLIRNS
ncbi:MAG: excinuclease ABC subunit UvrA [Herpetosiphonaceae bacterium]|nr:excinuclease ABC subunit UvrA [Herpetosiphonaceae bacterium]